MKNTPPRNKRNEILHEKLKTKNILVPLKFCKPAKNLSFQKSNFLNNKIRDLPSPKNSFQKKFPFHSASQGCFSKNIPLLDLKNLPSLAGF